MITMLWKELRENTKWAVLAMLGLGMAEFYALNQQQFFGFYVQESAPLLKSSFLMITTFGCAAVGLVLGLVQVLPEQRRDQWAALIHRPVPRATLFRGKAVAGFALYLVSTVLPFIACVWYVATPGHFGVPFSPRMIYPGVADICGGAMFYFAALFVALHRGPWYGTRAFGFLGALMTSLFASGNLPFYVAVEGIVLMSLALFTAAWGAMLSNGTQRSQPWIARFAALAVVFYGVTAIGHLVDVIASALLQTNNYYFGDRYIVDIDGRPLKMTTTKEGVSTFKDLSGNTVIDARLSKGMNNRNIVNFQNLTAFVGKSHGASNEEHYNPGYRSTQPYLASVNSYESVSDEAWFYLPYERLLVGYNEYSKARVGAFGDGGFYPPNQPARSFKDRLVGSQYGQISSFNRLGNTATFVDFGQRTLTTVFEQPGSEIFSLTTVGMGGTDPGLHYAAAVSLLDRVLIVNEKGNVLGNLPYHRDMDRYGNVQLGLRTTKDPIFVWYASSTWIPHDIAKTMPDYLEQVDWQGNMMKIYTLPKAPDVNFPRSWQQFISENLQTPAFYFGDMLYDKLGGLLGSHRLEQRWAYNFKEGWGSTKDHAPRITLLALIMAAIALVWARRSEFTWKRAWAWAGFVFLFNVAGLITFRLVADWPVRVKCPKCGGQRLVTEPTCSQCGAGWPLPVRDGTEIIEDQPGLTAV